MLKEENLLDYANLFSPNKNEKMTKCSKIVSIYSKKVKIEMIERLKG